MSDFYIYLHCKPDGTPFYVGKGMGRRCFEFFNSRRNPHHRNIVTKHGKENIGVHVFPCASEEESFDDEMKAIAQLRSEGFDLCNMTDGGEGQSGRTGGIPWNKGVTGLTAWNKGLKGVQTAWNKGIAGEKSHSFGRLGTMTGRKQSEETKRKISEGGKAAQERISSEQKEITRAKLSAANKGQIPWSKGLRQTPESVAKRVATRKATMEKRKLEGFSNV